jgi:hypothetical protein
VASARSRASAPFSIVFTKVILKDVLRQRPVARAALEEAEEFAVALDGAAASAEGRQT